ncbi:MAG: TolC family protein [Planctomycetes bacterium]|nr:TolC family protein [Planctomycetota bacterium]
MRRNASVASLCALAAGIGSSLFLAFLPGCKSAAAQRAQADKEVYELVAARRAKLGFDGAEFTIDPPKDSLRARILAGDAHGSGPLKLPQVLEIAGENSRDYRAQREKLYLAALDLTLERWQFKLQRTGELDAGVAGTGDTAETASAGGSFGLSKLLGSGANIALDIGAGMARSLTFQDGWHVGTNLGLSVTQPLLRGFGKRIVMEPLTQAERNLVYAVRAYERYRHTYAVDLATRYWRLLQSMNTVQNQERNLKSVQALSEENIAKAKAGRLSDIEVGQAHQQELTSQNALIDAQARLATALDDLKLFLGLPVQFDLEIDTNALEELSQQALGDELPEELVLPFALTHRLDHLTVLDQFDDRKRKVVVAADQLRSGLTLAANAGVASADGKPLDYDFSQTTWSATLSWQLPIDLLPQRNDYRKSIIDLESAARACEASHDTIEADLRDELRTMHSQREGYRIQQSAVSLAERRSASTDMNKAAGRANTRDALEAQDALLQARNSATSALIDYTLARLAVWRDLEILRVDKDGIHADEDALQHPDAGGAEAGQKPAGG